MKKELTARPEKMMGTLRREDTQNAPPSRIHWQG